MAVGKIQIWRKALEWPHFFKMQACLFSLHCTGSLLHMGSVVFVFLPQRQTHFVLRQLILKAVLNDFTWSMNLLTLRKPLLLSPVTKCACNFSISSNSMACGWQNKSAVDKEYKECITYSSFWTPHTWLQRITDAVLCWTSKYAKYKMD